MDCSSFSVPPRRARRFALSLATSASNPRRTSAVSLIPVRSAAFSINLSSMFNVVLICIYMHLLYADVNGLSANPPTRSLAGMRTCSDRRHPVIFPESLYQPLSTPSVYPGLPNRPGAALTHWLGAPCLTMERGSPRFSCRTHHCPPLLCRIYRPLDLSVDRS